MNILVDYSSIVVGVLLAAGLYWFQGSRLFSLAQGKVLSKIESYAAEKPSNTALVLVGIWFLRDLMEYFLENRRYVAMSLHAQAINSFFWAAVFVSILVFAFMIWKIPARAVFKILVLGWSFTFLAPVIDIVAVHFFHPLTTGFGYLKHDFFINLLSFGMRQTDVDGLTVGLQIEVGLGLIVGSFFTLIVTNSLWRSLLFYFGGGLLLTLHAFYSNIIWNVLLYTKFIHGVASPYLFTHPIVNMINGIVVSYALLILMAIVFFRTQIFKPLIKTEFDFFPGIKIQVPSFKEFIIWLRHSRPERILYSVSLVLCGAFFWGPALVKVSSEAEVNFIKLVAGIFIVSFGWFFGICLNDIYDYKIDQISNPQRPLPQGKISRGHLAALALFWGALTLCLIPFNALTFNLVIACGVLLYFYSVPPLRLRALAMPAAAISGGSAIIAIFIGALAQENVRNEIVSLWNVARLMLCFGLVSQVKDIKDYLGDQKGNVQTALTAFGLKRGKIWIAISLLIAAFLIYPLISHYVSITTWTLLSSTTIVGTFFLADRWLILFWVLIVAIKLLW